MDARHFFLTLIEQDHQGVLDPLAADVQPHYQADDGTLDEALFKWAARFSLLKDGAIAQWVESQAMKTISLWDQYPGLKGEWYILVPPLASMMRLPSDLEQIRIDVRSDLDQTLVDLRKRAEAEVVAFLTKLRSHAEAEGLKERSPILFRLSELGGSLSGWL